MIQRLVHLFPRQRWFYIWVGLAFVFACGFFIPWLFQVSQWLLVFFIGLSFYEIYGLVRRDNWIDVSRDLPRSLSLGAEHEIHLVVRNLSAQKIHWLLFEHPPSPFQMRSVSFTDRLEAEEQQTYHYMVRPTTRGLYVWGDIVIMIYSRWKWFSRRQIVKLDQQIPVYPSIQQMKEYEFLTFGANTQLGGIKRIRRVGHSHEFDHIKNYTAGDDYQKINWKASSKGYGFMVNHFEEERAQPIYLIMDTGRTMLMPFQGLSLLSHSINAALALSNIIIKKQDLPGLITFADQPKSFIPASRTRHQLKRILNALYNESQSEKESQLERLYPIIKSQVPHRSLLFLFSNFESQYGLKRVIPVLRLLSRTHMLVVILFENTEIEKMRLVPAQSARQAFHQTMADKYLFEKKAMVNELNQFGIQAILVKPEQLTPAVINKYLEAKARQLI